MTKYICECHGKEFKNKRCLGDHLSYFKHWDKARLQQKLYCEENKEVLKQKNHNFYLENREKILLERKKYHEEHKEQENLYNKEYYEKNKKELNLKHKIYFKKYYSEHREECIASSKRYAEADPERDRRQQKKYNQKPQAKLVARLQRIREDERLKTSSKLTVEKSNFIYERNTRHFEILTCELCFRPILPGQDNIEHFTAVGRHKEFPHLDLNSLDNLGIAHGANSKERCNQKKLNKTLDEWFNLHPEFDRNMSVPSTGKVFK